MRCRAFVDETRINADHRGSATGSLAQPGAALKILHISQAYEFMKWATTKSHNATKLIKASRPGLATAKPKPDLVQLTAFRWGRPVAGRPTERILDQSSPSSCPRVVVVVRLSGRRSEDVINHEGEARLAHPWGRRSRKFA